MLRLYTDCRARDLVRGKHGADFAAAARVPVHCCARLRDLKHSRRRDPLLDRAQSAGPCRHFLGHPLSRALIDTALCSQVPGVSLKKIIIVIIIGAASSFGTPFGYQASSRALLANCMLRLHVMPFLSRYYRRANALVLTCCDECFPPHWQTNLMVWRSGGYTFRDFLVFGGPLMAITGVSGAVLCELLID